MTRPLPSAVVTALPSASDVDVTRPLPRTAQPLHVANDSDSEFTQPLVPNLLVPRPPTSVAAIRSVPMVVVPPRPELPPVPVFVGVAPQSIGTVEQSPSIQIAGGSDRAPANYSVPPRGAMTTLPRIPRAAPIPADFAPRSDGSVMPVAGSIPPGALGNAPPSRWFLAVAAVAIGGIAVGAFLRSRPGSLVVTVSGPNGRAVAGVSVLIDGVERCAKTPCEVDGLAPGSHFVSASAAGLPASAERAMILTAGQHAAEHVSLTPEERALAGLNVAAVGDGLRVFVDGSDLGAPPVSVASVEPGEHTIRVEGDSRYYAPYESEVKLDSGEVRSLGPIRLHVRKGRLELRAADGADGASIAVDGKRIPALPAVLELSPDDAHEVTATRPGFTEFSQQVAFDDGAERTVDISLAPSADRASQSHVHFAANVRPRMFTAPTRASAGASVATAGVATLDLNSIPRANVVVNGRPLGMTPIRGVHVAPGRQTIVFVNPSLGRKFASTTVASGTRTAVGVRF